jgi:uncharacterized membrane protein (UPF0127 family)
MSWWSVWSAAARGASPRPPPPSPGIAPSLPRRLRHLPRTADGRARVAVTPLARLLGLALLRRPCPEGLLLPRARSVHTFGMRFALDLIWIDPRGRPIRVDLAVPPGSVRCCPRARAVLELPTSGRAPRRSTSAFGVGLPSSCRRSGPRRA